MFNNQNTNIPIGVLNESHTIDETIEMATKLKAIAIHPNFSSLNQDIVNTIHQAGFKIYSWTINEPDAISNAIKLGIDGIITDFPDRIPN